MSDLIVIGFRDKYQANAVLTQLRRLESRHLMDLEDAVVAERFEDGSVKLHQSHKLAAAGAVSGGFWGLLVGLLVMHPLVGALTGAAVGGVSGALADIGIDDEFMSEFSKTLTPGTSALFVLVRKVTADKVLDALSGVGGRVLETSLSYTDEERLQRALQPPAA